MKPNWITRLFVTLTTLTLVVLGFFFLTVALIVGAALALVIGVRFWWTLRKIRRSQGSFDQASASRQEAVVNGEYRIIERETVTTRLIQQDDPAQPPRSSRPSSTPPAP